MGAGCLTPESLQTHNAIGYDKSSCNLQPISGSVLVWLVSGNQTFGGWPWVTRHPPTGCGCLCFYWLSIAMGEEAYPHKGIHSSLYTGRGLLVRRTDALMPVAGIACDQ